MKEFLTKYLGYVGAGRGGTGQGDPPDDKDLDPNKP